MNKIECYIVCDLLPLYIDHACSVQTAKDVEAHLQSCEKCKKLYEEMSSDLRSAPHTPEFESNKIFRHAQKNILGIIIALAALISCFVINTGSAWEGGSAGLGNLTITILYIVFWGVFSFISRKYEPFINISFVISVITLISAVAGLISRISNRGGFITALLSIFSSIPFYGLRSFMGWTGLYAVAMALSLFLLIYIRYMKRKLKCIMSKKS